MALDKAMLDKIKAHADKCEELHDEGLMILSILVGERDVLERRIQQIRDKQARIAVGRELQAAVAILEERVTTTTETPPHD